MANFPIHSAQLVWITPDTEFLIAKLARVSNPANEENPDYVKLIRYLIKHNHWSPFEMASLCVEIHTDRAIAPQVLRHKSFSFQQFSERYAETAPVAFLPELRAQDHKNRQNSIANLPADIVEMYREDMEFLRDESFRIYRDMLADGVAKECARNILPAGLTSTRLYMSGTIRSWLHYCDLRCANGTQKEHRLIADSCRDILISEMPTVCEAMWPSDTDSSR